MRKILIVLGLAIGILMMFSCNKPEDLPQPTSSVVVEGCDCTTYSETKYDSSDVWIINTHSWEADCVERVYFDGIFDNTATGGERGYWKSYIKCN